MKRLLKLDKNTEHNCTDKKVIEWCVRNLDTKNFHYSDINFGCSCENEDDQTYQIEPEDGEEAAEFLKVRDIEMMRVHYCPECGEWAVDDDF